MKSLTLFLTVLSSLICLVNVIQVVKNNNHSATFGWLSAFFYSVVLVFYYLKF